MKVDVVVELSGRKKLAPLQMKVLDYLEAHRDEVFTYRDEELARKLSMKPAALAFTLWTLQKRDCIAKAMLDGKVYFGSHTAVAELKRRAAPAQEEDWFDAAVRLREEIFKKHGYINVLELLDEVREGR